MSDICILCAGKLDTPLILDNMPSSAQGFGLSQNKALDDSCRMGIYECSYCGLVQYSGPYVPYYKEVIRSTHLSPPMLEFRKQQFQEIVQQYEVCNVFELGAGGGEYLDVFKLLGVKTYGIEASVELAKKARDARHLVVDGFFPGTDLSLNSELHSFDLACSFNFVEHLPDPIGTLRCLNSVLKPGGYALLEVPNFDMIANFGLFNEFIPDHRSYFTSDSFQLLLSLSGFEVLKLESVWDSYILSALVRKRPVVDWSLYKHTQKSLLCEIEAFFRGSPRAHNAIWSAGHQSLATISNLNLTGLISVIVDSSPVKQNTFAPASGLPILAPDILFDGGIRKILLAAAGFNAEIASVIRKKYSADIKIGFLNKGVVESE
jgi:SAM-dependent methyltransferase